MISTRLPVVFGALPAAINNVKFALLNVEPDTICALITDDVSSIIGKIRSVRKCTHFIGN